MKKTLLILTLCAPLGWFSLHEVHRLADDWRSQIELDPDDEAGGSAVAEDKLKELRGNADKVVNLPDEMVRAAVAFDDPPGPSAPPAPGSVDADVVALGADLARRRADVNTVRDEAANFVQDIEASLQRLRGEDGRPGKGADVTGLKKLISDLRRKEVHDADLADSAEAEADWPRLDAEHPRAGLDRLYERIDRWTPAGVEPAPVEADARVPVKAYGEYLDRHGRAKGSYAVALVKEARERYELWRRGADLSARMKARSGRAPAASFVRAVAELAAADDPPARFVASARRVALALCADLLPEEKLDDKVVVNDGGVPRKIARATLGVVWKDRNAKSLEKSGYNEFTLKPADVDSLVFNNELLPLPRDGTPPLSPTEYSQAVFTYNEERSRVRRWSVDELSRLRAVCERNREELNRGPGAGDKALLARVDALLDVVRRYPSVFSVDPD